ncbi:uncharacterized protein LOC116249090 [Nymphaea colorata]|nr:uncharacterized protein LOC116249090 [Nymphaea colorata]XP_049932408.1 uncharacterized protein LOC116249090 [Nymphaea colorata]
MATNSNMGFHQGTLIPPAAYNRHAISFQTGAISSSSGIHSPDTGGFGEAFSALKHDTGLAVDWSPEEQSILEKGLMKYAGEPNIMKYVKIASELREKTVRDVALRCRWMTRKESGKRRKLEDCYSGKKLRDRKEKTIESSSRANICPVPQLNLGTYPFMVHQIANGNALSSQAMTPTMTTTTQHLLEENNQVFNQIAANLQAYKVQDNIELFLHARNNITAILNDMNGMPGIMSQMPPLQVTINEELASTILPNTSQVISYERGYVNSRTAPRHGFDT